MCLNGQACPGYRHAGWCLSTARIFKLRHYQLRLRRQNILTVRGVPSPIILLSAAHLMTDSTC